MHIEIDQTQRVAPMSDICHQWQEKGTLEFDWYFDSVKKFGANQIIFNSLKPNSELFNQLNQVTIQKQMKPLHVLTVEQFCEMENLSVHLEAGVQFAILLYGPMSAEFICRVEEQQKFIEQFQFIIIARKDWNVRNCFRSIPHFMRSRLRVDFPASLHASDPFFGTAEAAQAKSQLQEDFPGETLPSFFPNLHLANDWSEKNISHFSKPRKLSKNKPKVSLIACNSDDIAVIENSKLIKENPESFEVVLVRVAGQKTKVIRTVPGLLSTKYWAHPMDADRSVSKVVLANFAATQADGEMLVFLDSKKQQDIDVVLSLILEGDINPMKMLARRGLFIFEKDLFFKKGGFDELLQSWEGQEPDVLARFYNLNSADNALNKVWDEKIRTMTFQQDKILLAHRYSDQLNHFEPIEASVVPQESQKESRSDKLTDLRKDILAQVYHLVESSGIMGVFGALKYLSTIGRDQSESVFWKIFYLPRFIFIAMPNYIFWKTVYLPRRLMPFFSKFYWMGLYTPLSRMYWKLVYLPKKLYGVAVWMYWTLFRASYPARKIYYFVQFQWEKRVLGLHQSGRAGDAS